MPRAQIIFFIKGNYSEHDTCIS